MLIKCEQIGEVEVMYGLNYAGRKGEVITDGMHIYGEDLRGEEGSIWLDNEDINPEHKATIQRLMEDIRKPAAALRDYVYSIASNLDQRE